VIVGAVLCFLRDGCTFYTNLNSCNAYADFFILWFYLHCTQNLVKCSLTIICTEAAVQKIHTEDEPFIEAE
jgi:hypothetical protein